MRNTAPFDTHSRRRWSTWLKTVMPPVTPTALARALTDEGTGKDSEPRAMVYAWRAAQRTTHSDMAWRTGQALRNLGSPVASGITAVYAAGHYEVFLGLIRTLALKPGRSRVLAAKLYVYVPLATGAIVDPNFAREAKQIDRERRLHSMRTWAFSKYIRGAATSINALTAADWGEVESAARNIGIGSLRKSSVASRMKFHRSTRVPRSLRALDREYCVPTLQMLATMQTRNPLRSWRLAVINLNVWATELASMVGINDGQYYGLLAALDKALSLAASDTTSAFYQGDAT